jgi:hypothetical protein
LYTAYLGIIVKGTNLRKLSIVAIFAITDTLVERDIDEKGVRREKLASEAALV